MADKDPGFEPYRVAIEAPTRHVAECDAGSRLEAVGHLMRSIATLIGAPAEWSQAGTHYTTWAELHDLTDVFDDAAAFDEAARIAAVTWLDTPRNEPAHGDWLTERKAWMETYARTHQTAF